MATPDREAIDTFISITGASEGVAFSKLEEHGGDLNEAVNSYFSEGDQSNTRPARIPTYRNTFMDMDDYAEFGQRQPPFSLSLLSAARYLNPFSLLDSGFHRSFFEGTSFANFTSGTPRVTHPREVREIPIEFKDTNTRSGHSGLSPAIEDVTGTPYAHGPEIHGTVTMDDEDEDTQTDPSIYSSHRNEEFGFLGGRHRERNHTLNAPAIDSVTDYTNDDIEEEIFQAAIEASTREVAECLPNQHTGAIADSSGPSVRQTMSHTEDPDLARAVSLSLKTAEQEKALREYGGVYAGVADQSVSIRDSEELGRSEVNGRHGTGSFNKTTLNRPKELEAGSSFIPDEVEDVEEQPLVRQRSRRVTSGANSAKEASKVENSKPLSQDPHGVGRHPQINGAALPSDVWGGISSQEHDEAVMLEAALFGGLPETSAYHYGYPRQEQLQSSSDRVFYRQPVPRPLSSNLEAQRLLREQQDDEYLASLQADREKELKAMEEAEARRLSEKAAMEAALEEERRKDEESHRKLLQEEEIERQLAAKEASLPVEPALGDDNAVTLLVRMPDGNRCGRRFLKSDNLQSVFDFIDVGRVVKPRTYRLVRAHPRRAFNGDESNLSLSSLGLTGKQEALFLELV